MYFVADFLFSQLQGSNSALILQLSLCNEHRATLQGVTQEMSFIQTIEELSNSTYFVV